MYYFGSGTTDVAIARIEITDSGEINPKVLSVGGLPNLGGSNFDEAISAHYMSVNNYDLSDLPMKDQLHDKWMIELELRNTKEELSGKSSVERTINRLKVTGGVKPQKFTLTQEEFMSVCATLIERFDEPVYDTLTSAWLSAKDIETVILAGGSSAMPFVKGKMSGIFPAKKILLSTSAEIIAQGLAVYGRAELLGTKVLSNGDGGHDSGTRSGHEEGRIPTGTLGGNEPRQGNKGGVWKTAAAIVLAAGLGWGAFYAYSGYKVYSDNAEKVRLQAQLEQQRRQQYTYTQPKKESNTAGNVAAVAATGAVAGSFIPIVGTTMGAVIGGIAGWLARRLVKTVIMLQGVRYLLKLNFERW